MPNPAPRQTSLADTFLVHHHPGPVRFSALFSTASRRPAPCRIGSAGRSCGLLFRGLNDCEQVRPLKVLPTRSPDNSPQVRIALLQILRFVPQRRVAGLVLRIAAEAHAIQPPLGMAHLSGPTSIRGTSVVVSPADSAAAASLDLFRFTPPTLRCFGRQLNQ